MNSDLSIYTHDLPAPLALVLEEYIQEDRPYVKLHRLIDAAEMATRFLFIVAITDALKQLDPLPKDLKRKLAKELLRPSFGKWKELLTDTLKSLHSNKRVCFIPELPALWDDVWFRLIGTNKDSRETAILPLRNHVAHVRIPDDAAQHLLEPIQGAFESGFQQLAELLQPYQLIAVTGDNTSYLLRGVPQLGNLQLYANPARDWEPGLVYLVDNAANSLKLFPLHLYHDVLEISETQCSDDSIPVPMLYLQYNSKHNHLEFTVLSPSTSCPHFWPSKGEPLYLYAFFEMFRIREWEDEQKRHQDMKKEQDIAIQMISEHKYDFEDLEKQYPDLRSLYGRDEQLVEVQKQIKRCHSTGGYLWINGAPGVGKSAFMFGLRQRMRTEKKNICIFFSFRTGDGRCAPEHFYRATLLHLKQPFEESRPLKDQFQSALRHHVEQSDKPLLFLLDGMNEIAVVYPDFLSEALSCATPGIVWVCAGLGAAPALVNDIFWITYPLQTLTEENVRTWLTHDLERKKYALFERDIEQDDGSFRNTFIETLVTRSEGLPLYITLTLEDLRAERINLTDEAQLPQGLSGYYEQLLGRLKVSDSSTLLGDILSLLSRVAEPLEITTIGQILAPHYANDAPDWPKLLQDTLQIGATILRQSPTSEQSLGWTLYHDSLRKHLQSAPTVATAQRRAQRLLLTWCADWGKHQHPYAIRQYARHLIEKEDWETLQQLLLPSKEHKPWADIRYDLEHHYGGCLDDLAKLAQHARATQDIALQVECALVRTSLNDMSYLTPELLVALVTIGTPQGKWTPEIVLEYVPHLRQEQQIKALRLFSEKSVPLPRERTRELIDAISNEDERLKLLHAYEFPLSLEQQTQIQALAHHQYEPLPENLEQTLTTLNAPKDQSEDEIELADTLLWLVHRFNAEKDLKWLEQIVASIHLLNNPARRAWLLTLLLEKLPVDVRPKLLQTALEAAQSIDYGLNRKFKLRIPEELSDEVKIIRQIPDRRQRFEALAALYPKVPNNDPNEYDWSDRPPEDLPEEPLPIRIIWNNVNQARELKARALLTLLNYLDGEIRRSALEQAFESVLLMGDHSPALLFYDDEDHNDKIVEDVFDNFVTYMSPFDCSGYKTALLIDIAPLLSDAQLAQLAPFVADDLEKKRRINIPSYDLSNNSYLIAYLNTIADLAPYLSSDLLNRTLERIQKLPEYEYQYLTPVILQLAPHLPFQESLSLFEEIIRNYLSYYLEHSSFESWRLQIVPYLSVELSLVFLAYLDGPCCDEVSCEEVFNEDLFVEYLGPLLPQLLPLNQHEVLAAICSIGSKYGTEALTQALPYFPESEQPAILAKILTLSLLYQNKFEFEERFQILLLICAHNKVLQPLIREAIQTSKDTYPSWQAQSEDLQFDLELLPLIEEPWHSELADYLHPLLEKAHNAASKQTQPPPTPSSLQQCWEQILPLPESSREGLLAKLSQFVRDTLEKGVADRTVFTRIAQAIDTVHTCWP